MGDKPEYSSVEEMEYENLKKKAYADNDEKIAVVEGMTRYGGHFIQTMGHALAIADVVNAQKIKETWPEEWAKYLEWGQKFLDENDPVSPKEDPLAPKEDPLAPKDPIR